MTTKHYCPICCYPRHRMSLMSDGYWTCDSCGCREAGATRALQHRTNNGYDSVLLVEAGIVLGEWSFGSRTAAEVAYADGSPADWSETFPDDTDPDAYGELLDERV